MTEQERPSVHDWPAMATDLIERASQLPNYGDPGHQSIAGMFAREGTTPVIVTCTIDVPQQSFKVLHIAISLMGRRGLLPSKDVLEQILGLFDKNPPYTYKSASGLLHCLWPFPWTDQDAHNYIKQLILSKQ
jgi:hypothetical protein